MEYNSTIEFLKLLTHLAAVIALVIIAIRLNTMIDEVHGINDPQGALQERLQYLHELEYLESIEKSLDDIGRGLSYIHQ
ncbi:hypothetical protein RCL_jg13351.t1 [Rhizophagus clarus]|uniref:Uncharacterized protein n=1 Tax=Rhizophagus clarus TaxID=94130 RepID=A0A8H3QSH6_9GLOM|nr:hypothetical protein RCL_jg13351.t1 [Rhizophagus clarus]